MIKASEPERVGVKSENTIEIGAKDANAAWARAMDFAKEFRPDMGRDRRSVLGAIAVGRAIADCFPDSVHTAAAVFAREGNDQGAFLLRGLPPFERLLEGVVLGEDDLLREKSARAAGLIAVSAATLFGPPFGYRDSYADDPDAVTGFITQVTPNGLRSITGTNRAGGLHAEAGASENRPNALVLTCIRPGDGDAITSLAPVQQIMKRLSPATIAALREPLFLAPDGMVTGSGEEKVPLLRDTPRGPAFILGEGYRERQTAEVGWVMDALYEVLEGPGLLTRHRIGPGEVLVLDNNGLHGRTAFRQSEPPEPPRWIMRTFAGWPGTPPVSENV